MGSMHFVLLLLTIMAGFLLQKYLNHEHLNKSDVNRIERALTKLGNNGRSVFKTFDKNKDEKIDLEEFFEVYQALKGVKQPDIENFKNEMVEDYNPEIDEVVQLEAEVEPLILSTMSQTKKESDFGLPGFSYSREFSGLLAWKSVHIAKQEFLAKEFHVFLPPTITQELGKPYWILPKSDAIDENMSSNVYRPPTPSSNIEKLIHKLLSMLHPRPFILMRFPPQGGVAAVRARNKVYLDIQFRLHCEFQLNELPHPVFWFTPSQFEGRLTISRDGSHVRDFSIRVPNETKLNVDMEWQIDDNNVNGGNDSNMEVDIGYIPLMRIKQLVPSSPAVLNDGSGTIIDRREMWKNGQDVHLEFDKIAWLEEISFAEAKREIEILFYPFKKVDYLSFESAFERAKAESKLVHQVVLWGALDDQSC